MAHNHPAPASFAGWQFIIQVEGLLVAHLIDSAQQADAQTSCEGCDNQATNPTGQAYMLVSHEGRELWCHQCFATIMWPMAGEGGFVIGELVPAPEGGPQPS